MQRLLIFDLVACPAFFLVVNYQICYKCQAQAGSWYTRGYAVCFSFLSFLFRENLSGDGRGKHWRCLHHWFWSKPRSVKGWWGRLERVPVLLLCLQQCYPARGTASAFWDHGRMFYHPFRFLVLKALVSVLEWEQSAGWRAVVRCKVGWEEERHHYFYERFRKQITKKLDSKNTVNNLNYLAPKQRRGCLFSQQEVMCWCMPL